MHTHINEQVDELRDRIAALELRLEYMDGHRSREIVRQVSPEELERLEEQGRISLTRVYRSGDGACGEGEI